MNRKDLKDLILIQNRYRFLKDNLKNLDSQVVFLRKCLNSMSENLYYLNEKKIYDNLNFTFANILDELKTIKNKMESLPDKLSFRVLKDLNLADISFDVCELNLLTMKYMNHIAPNNLYMLLDLFIGTDKLYNNLSKNDTIILDILFSIFRPTSVWHSFHQ